MTLDRRKTLTFQALDSLWHAMQGRWTMNFSPVATQLAVGDWLLHLANSPGTQADLWAGFFGLTTEAVTERVRPRAKDPGAKGDLECGCRFDDPLWGEEPFLSLRVLYRLGCRWWEEYATDVPGMKPRHKAFISFLGRQMLELYSPCNHLFTNPELLRHTSEEKGANLVRGGRFLAEDLMRVCRVPFPLPDSGFQVGKNLAVTKGRVIYRNRLMEIIQYSPSTPEVFENPVLIVPAWIMKYYILDLSPHNSMVKHLVDQGHTVFMVSWKNPGYEDRETDLEDYIELGVMDAVEKVEEVVPERKVHVVGYCLGGTLSAMAASAMARDGDDRLKSLTMLAAQTDFSEAGELMLFIGHAQLSFLEDIMQFQGYLDAGQMAAAFQMLRSYDLIWGKWVTRYLKGEQEFINDLMAWNADTTRMPSRMHSRYLRELFLNNDFFEGRFRVKGRPVVVSDIHVPVFIVAPEKDHVSPWTSVYKFHLSSDARSVTFVLTRGGHNAGIVSEPGHHGRSYRIATAHEGQSYVPPGHWYHDTPVKDGSWWVDWHKWLMGSSGKKSTPPDMGGFTGEGEACAAPGTYVFGT
ncbi:poly-beta-hydroxybutyrate polymerase [Desulfoluna limicola]|uniref:Poly-beta-hydroxybutyrate polymerase n=1 Tax=Desulfoluna limicola TaxID=2810562 RepID=A0ABM7PJH0_9BACT|nr:alpha/beta fold hydrolase [Desulfoluna limicola]BCS97298.1 poly-beta-hydroxybutyrate polymerase [Desulfoluna limicola]